MQSMHKLPQMMVWLTTFRQSHKEGNEKDKKQLSVQHFSSSVFADESGPAEPVIRPRKEKGLESGTSWSKTAADAGSKVGPVLHQMSLSMHDIFELKRFPKYFI